MPYWKIFFRILLFVGIFFVVRQSENIKKSQKITTEDALMFYANGFLISRGLYVVVKLNIAEQLVSGRKTAQDLADALNLNAQAVHSLLRMLASHGMFEFTEDKYFALNKVSILLTKDHPKSMRNMFLHQDEARWKAYSELGYTIKTGKPAFNHLFGEGYFDYISKDSQLAADFDEGMAGISAQENKEIAKQIDFSWFNNVVDVGSGVGGLSVELLKVNNNLHATLYDLSHVQPQAEAFLAQRSEKSRINFVAGSFLEQVISGGDLYLLKRILHDWDDQTCIKILFHVAQAMKSGAQLMIFDCVVPAENSSDISKDIDVMMMTIFGGRERTEQDFKTLLSAVGLEFVDAKPVKNTMLWAITAHKK